jgi:regulator of nucleoside diphosphate kinase
MPKRIIVTASDVERLERLLESRSRQSDYVGLEALEHELDRADIVNSDTISKHIVTMNSRVRLHDLDRDVEFVCSIVFPAEADSEQGRVSVLAPLGVALLGYRVGHIVRFETPGGTRRVKIKAIEYQPEAATRERMAKAEVHEVESCPG